MILVDNIESESQAESGIRNRPSFSNSVLVGEEQQIVVCANYSETRNQEQQSKVNDRGCVKILRWFLVVAIVCLMIVGVLYFTMKLNVVSVTQQSFLQTDYSQTNRQKLESFQKQLQSLNASQLQQQTTVFEGELINEGDFKERKIEKGRFNISLQVWAFELDGGNYLQQLMVVNNKRFSFESGFRYNTLNLSTYSSYLSPYSNNKLEIALNTLRDSKDPSLKQQLDSIIKRLILFSVLYERGGIILEGPLTLTEKLDWVIEIESNMYVNRGAMGRSPHVVGFYSPRYSSRMRKQKKFLYPGMQEVHRYMVRHPALQSYFLAAERKADFIGKVIEEMISILIYPESVAQDISQNKYEYYGLGRKDVYYQYTALASHRVIQNQQRSLGDQYFAIDTYGLYVLNSYYGPYKLERAYWARSFSEKEEAKRIPNMVKFDLSEYEATFGPMRYLQMTNNFAELNDFLVRIRDGQIKNQVMKGSYIQRMFFPGGDQPFIYENRERGMRNQTGLSWDALPRTIWIYWDKGIGSAAVEVFLCVQNLKRMSAPLGFEVKQVNDSNLKDYLSQQSVQKIEYVLANHKMNIFPASKSDLVRLALIYEHGGVYVDASVVAVQGLDWLVNIARFPTEYVFNRYGELPSALVFWNGFYRGLIQWQIDEVANTKSGWRYTLQSSILIAVKNCQFIKEWRDLHRELLLKSWGEVLKVYEESGIMQIKAVSQNDHYLLVLDAAKCVIGRRLNWLKGEGRGEWRGAMDYYKLWLVSIYLGPFKIREDLNYVGVDAQDENGLFTRYSQEYAEGLTGKWNFFVKFTGKPRKDLSKFIEQNYDRIQEETHSQSYFRKYFFDSGKYRFQKREGKIVVVNRL